MNPCSSRSRSPLAVGLTLLGGFVRGPSRRTHCFRLAFQPSIHKSARDCRGFPSPESVLLLAVLPVVQGRASRVLSDNNNHPLTAPRLPIELKFRRTENPFQQPFVRNASDSSTRVISEETSLASLSSTKPTVPLWSFRLTAPGEPGSIAPNFHAGDTKAVPPVRHP